MRQITFPNWLVSIDKNLKWLSIPKLPLLLTLVQVFGFFLVMREPSFEDLLVLNSIKVFEGEFWRIFTFIAIPIEKNFLLFFVLWFFYDVMCWLEESWGSTLLTIYFLFAWFSAVLASFLGIPIKTFVLMESSFFFALATLNPNREIHLLFILPIAFKWIAVFIAVALVIVPLFLASSEGIFYVLLILANYIIFFGKDYWLRLKKELERRRLL
jgi:hypothetical protein